MAKDGVPQSDWFANQLRGLRFKRQKQEKQGFIPNEMYDPMYARSISASKQRKERLEAISVDDDWRRYHQTSWITAKSAEEKVNWSPQPSAAPSVPVSTPSVPPTSPLDIRWIRKPLGFDPTPPNGFDPTPPASACGAESQHEDNLAYASQLEDDLIAEVSSQEVELEFLYFVLSTRCLCSLHLLRCLCSLHL